MSSEMAIFENPQALTQAMSFADTISKSGVIPSTLIGKPADILVVLLTGRELGLSPMQSLRSIHVVQGKPVLGADLYRALAMGHRDCEYFRLVESSALKATFATKRKGSDEQQKTYTIDDARLAGLTNKDNWKRMPTEMLVARCSAILARLVYPDAFAGVYNESEEPDIVGDVQPPPPPQGKTRTEQLLNRVKKVEPKPTPQEAEIVGSAKLDVGSDMSTLDDVPPPTDDDAPPPSAPKSIDHYAQQVLAKLGGKIESQRNEGDYVFTFGKFSGKAASEVDIGGLKWIAANATRYPEAQEAAKIEIERRGK